MKKAFKKAVSLVLALALMISVSAVCFAAHETEKTPVILIPGFGQSQTLVYDDNGEFLGDISTFELAGLETKTLVMNVIKELLLPLGVSAITRNDVALSKAVKGFMEELFKPFALNDNGSAVYNKKVRSFNKPYSELSKEEQSLIYSNVSLDKLGEYDSVRYYYTYDSFGSVKAAAEGLHDYLHNVVLAQTGAKKVNFVPISQGGAVFIQYIAMFPEDAKYIKKLVCMIPAFDGSQIVGDILLDNVRVYDIERLHREILPALLEGDGGYQASVALRLALSSKTLEKVLRTAVAEARDMLALKSSMMWALCPSGSYEEARNLLLSDEKYAAVRAETESFNAARKAFPQTLKALKENGTYVHIIASYNMGYFLAPLFNCHLDDADNLLAPYSAALGATAAEFGKAFAEDYASPKTYCNNPAHNHISPDRKIDASTGFLPENTWFFKSVSHMGMNGREDVKGFAAELVMDDDIRDIYSCPGYGQFTDPAEKVSSRVLSQTGKSYLCYDKDGNYLYAERIPTDSGKTFSFWKLLYTAFNGLFSVFSGR